MRKRTVGAVALRPSGNVQGSFYYYSLVTGRRLHRRRCTPLPMPQEVIDRTHFIANNQKTPEGKTFLRRDGTEFVELSEARATDLVEEDNNSVEVIENDNVQDNFPVPIDVDQEYMGADDESNGENDANNENNDLPFDNDDHDTIDIPTIDEVQGQPEDIIEGTETDVNGAPIHSDLTTENIIPEGVRRSRDPKRRDTTEVYQLANVSIPPNTDSDTITPSITTEHFDAMTTYV